MKCWWNWLQIFVPDIYIYRLISFEKRSLLQTVEGLFLDHDGFRYTFLPLFHSVASFVVHILWENTFSFMGVLYGTLIFQRIEFGWRLKVKGEDLRLQDRAPFCSVRGKLLSPLGFNPRQEAIWSKLRQGVHKPPLSLSTRL
jgi:hypothetical protein